MADPEIDTTERMLTPLFDYDQEMSAEMATAEYMGFRQMFRNFGFPFNWTTVNDSSYGYDPNDYDWSDSPNDDYINAMQYYAFEQGGISSSSYGGTTYTNYSNNQVYGSTGFSYNLPFFETYNRDVSAYCIPLGIEFVNKIFVTKIQVTVPMYKSQYSINGRTVDTMLPYGSNGTACLWNSYITYEFDEYGTPAEGSGLAGFPLYAYLDSWEGGYTPKENGFYDGSGTIPEPYDDDRFFRDEYYSYWWKKAKFRYSSEKFSKDASYQYAEADVSVSYNLPFPEYNQNNWECTVTFTFPEAVEAKSIWLNGMDYPMRPKIDDSYWQEGYAGSFIYWSVFGYGDLSPGPQWQDIETYKPRILLAYEESQYDLQGEPYWVIRYGSDTFSPRPAGSGNIKPHLQWILKFPNRGCKSYPEDFFMIDEVWIVTRGTWTYLMGRDKQRFDVPRKYFFAHREDAIKYFPDDPNKPYTNAIFNLRITCMALRHYLFCMTTEFTMVNYRLVEEYYRQMHWDSFTPLKDPAVDPHKATNANIRFWFGAIKKVEEIFDKDFRGAGYPMLTQWEQPPFEFSESATCYTTNDWGTFPYECNPYVGYPQHLWSRTIMPNRHGTFSGQPKSFSEDWKGKYSSRNPCAIDIPNEGEGDEYSCDTN